jgi:phage repressor protein C with HTH and peptisase S24 domain
LFSHERIWAALDSLAEENKLSPSGLARQSGLDPTSFNKSKRVINANRLRWPSTESISKALQSTDTSLAEFLNHVEGRDLGGHGFRSLPKSDKIPLLGLAQAGVGGYFDDSGFPQGQGWEQIDFPRGEHDAIYALEVSGDSMLPLFRQGDILIVAPNPAVRVGDRVVVKTLEGEVMAKILQRKTAENIELLSLNQEHDNRSFSVDELEWVARIVWASQ